MTDNRKGCPYGCACKSISFSAENFHILSTIQRRQQATALPRCRLLRKRWTNRFESCRKAKQKTADAKMCLKN